MLAIAKLQSFAAALAAEPPAPKSSDAPPGKPEAIALPKITRRAGSDWPAFLGPTHDSKSTETGILASWPDAGPPIVWQTEIAGGYGPPAISAGRLFIFDRPADQARLRVLESETGRPLWAFRYPTDYQDLYGYDAGPRASPVVDDDRVYIFGPDGMLHCLRSADGKLLWKVDTAEKFGVVQNFFGVGSTPLVEGELLIVQVGGSPAESRRVPPGALDQVVGNGSGIVAFDKRSGEVKYQITDELASYSSPTVATIDGRRWCFVLARGGLVGFEPRSGKVDFQFPWRAPNLESVNASNPVVSGDRVFISETYGPGSALIESPSGRRGSAMVGRRAAARQVDANSLEYADRSRRLFVRFERSARRGGRVALHRTGHRQGALERTAVAAIFAAVCRRTFRLFERGRLVAAHQNRSREVQSGQRCGPGQSRFTRGGPDSGRPPAIEAAGLGRAGPGAWAVVRAGPRPAGLPGSDSAVAGPRCESHSARRTVRRMLAAASTAD